MPGSVLGLKKAINNYGQVIANSVQSRSPILWTPAVPNGTDGTLTDLSGTLGAASLVAVNDRGQIVGFASNPGGDFINQILLWSPIVPNGISGSKTKLGPSTDAYPIGINNFGQVAGQAGIDGSSFIWTPTSPNGSLGTMNTASGLAGLVGLNDFGQAVTTISTLFTPFVPNGSIGDFTPILSANAVATNGVQGSITAGSTSMAFSAIDGSAQYGYLRLTNNNAFPVAGTFSSNSAWLSVSANTLAWVQTSTHQRRFRLLQTPRDRAQIPIRAPSPSLQMMAVPLL